MTVNGSWIVNNDGCCSPTIVFQLEVDMLVSNTRHPCYVFGGHWTWTVALYFHQHIMVAQAWFGHFPEDAGNILDADPFAIEGSVAAQWTNEATAWEMISRRPWEFWSKCSIKIPSFGCHMSWTASNAGCTASWYCWTRRDHVRSPSANFWVNLTPSKHGLLNDHLGSTCLHIIMVGWYP